MNDITYAVSVDVNSPTIPYNVYVASVLDSNVRYLEITLYQNGNVITLSNTATATASLVTDGVLIDDSVECTISNNIITVPLEDLQRHGNLDVQVTVTEDTKVLAIPFPIQVRVTPNIAENAQIDENSSGSYAEVVHEISEARGSYTNLKERLDHTGATDEQVAKAVEDYLDEHGIDTVAAFDSENDEVIKYMSAEPQTDSEYAYSNVNTSLSERKDIPGAFSVTPPAGTACLRIVDCQSGDEWKETAGAGDYEIRNLIPGRIYRYYALKANGTILDSGSCTGRGQVRMIDVPQANGERNVFNIRDLGGWACSGGIMKYGLVFRGGRLNGSNPGVTESAIELTEQQIAYFKNVLHIADEIDLRTSNEISQDGISGSALGEAVSWINKTLGYYQNSLTDSTSANYAFLINRLAENLAAGKVTYIHCNSGADRTAQLCMFIEAICGVSLIDMERDYELTSYAFEYRSGQIDRRRNKITDACWKTLMQALDSETGSTIQEKAVSFLLRKGVTSSAISTIREKLVENSGGNTDISGKADKATTLAGYGITDAYTKDESDVKFFEFLDGTFASNPNISPTLLVDNTIDATYNPNGHYILYYIDSDGGRHNLFDFSVLPMSYTLTAQDKADIADIVLGELPTTQGVLYGNASN